MKKEIRNEQTDQFFDAILSLRSREECYSFFDDICTVNELHAMSQRLEVGIRLMRKQTYLDISESTGASTATISRVNRLLADDETGLEMAFERLGKI